MIILGWACNISLLSELAHGKAVTQDSNLSRLILGAITQSKTSVDQYWSKVCGEI